MICGRTLLIKFQVQSTLPGTVSCGKLPEGPFIFRSCDYSLQNLPKIEIPPRCWQPGPTDLAPEKYVFFYFFFGVSFHRKLDDMGKLKPETPTNLILKTIVSSRFSHGFPLNPCHVSTGKFSRLRTAKIWAWPCTTGRVSRVSPGIAS